jgi:hypothetical protein
MTSTQRELRAAVARLIHFPDDQCGGVACHPSGYFSWRFSTYRYLTAEQFQDPELAFQGVKLDRLPTRAEWKPLAKRLLEEAQRI